MHGQLTSLLFDVRSLCMLFVLTRDANDDQSLSVSSICTVVRFRLCPRPHVASLEPFDLRRSRTPAIEGWLDCRTSPRSPPSSATASSSPSAS